MRTLLLVTLSLSLMGSALARPNPPANVQRPVNNPRPTGTTTQATVARPMFFTGSLVNQFAEELTVQGADKKQTFKISSRSQIPSGLAPGTQVTVTYTTSPQGWEVVRLIAKPAP